MKKTKYCKAEGGISPMARSFILLSLCLSFCVTANSAELYKTNNGSAAFTRLNAGSVPRDVFADESHVFVADSGLKAVTIWNRDAAGALVGTFRGGDGGRLLTGPTSIDIMETGGSRYAVIADGNSIFVCSVSTNGTGVPEFRTQSLISLDSGSFSSAAFGSNGDIFAVRPVFGSLNVYKQEEAGDFGSYRLYASIGSLSSYLSGADGMDIDPSSGRAVFACREKNMIVSAKIDMNTLSVSEIRTAGGAASSEAGMFSGPSGVSLWTNGTICVADSLNNRIQVLNSDMSPMISFGSYGTSEGEFSMPYGIFAEEGTESVFVADTRNRRMQLFDVYVDSDGDGMPDFWELEHGFDPAVPDGDADSDADGLTNSEEYLYGTNPRNWDTDGDGVSDGYEVLMSYDPCSAGSVPPSASEPVFKLGSTVFPENCSKTLIGYIVFPEPAETSAVYNISGYDAAVFSGQEQVEIKTGECAAAFEFTALDGLKDRSSVTIGIVSENGVVLATKKVYVENISPEIESVSFRPSDWGAVGEAVEITLNASDPAGDRDLLSYLCKVYRNVNGSWVYDRMLVHSPVEQGPNTANGAVCYSITPENLGSLKFEFTVSDKDGASASKTVIYLVKSESQDTSGDDPEPDVEIKFTAIDVTNGKLFVRITGQDAAGYYQLDVFRTASFDTGAEHKFSGIYVPAAESEFMSADGSRSIRAASYGSGTEYTLEADIGEIIENIGPSAFFRVLRQEEEQVYSE